MLRSILYSICVVMLLPAAALNASAEPVLCQDSFKVECTQRISNQIPATAKRISLEAAKAVNFYLGEKYPLETYADSLRAELRKLPIETGFKSAIPAIARTILYMGCADYIARAAFAEDSAQVICFKQAFVPSNANPSLQEIVAPVQELSVVPKVEEILQDSKYWVIQSLERGNLKNELKTPLINRLTNTGNMSIASYMVSNVLHANVHELETTADMLLDKLDDCDFDHLTLNAFSVSYGENIRLVVCPGLWVTAMQTHSNPKANRAMLDLMHEYGHSVEGGLSEWKDSPLNQDKKIAQLSKQGYHEVVSCVEKTQVKPGRLFTYIPGHAGESAYEDFVKRLDFKVQKALPDLFFAEYSADVISAKAFGLFLNQFSVADRELILRDGLDDYCVVMDHEALSSPKLEENLSQSMHPSDPFRLEQIIMSTPEIRNALGCSSQSVQTSCAFY